MDTQTLSQKPQNQKWGFFSTMLWSIVVIAACWGSSALTSIIYAQVVYADISMELLNKVTYGPALPLCVFISYITGGLILCGIIKLKKNSNLKEYLALNRASLHQIICWGLVALAFILLGNLITYFKGKPLIGQYMINLYNSTSQPWIIFFLFVVAIPVFEELFFRGFLFSGFSSSFVSAVGAIIITSLLWTALHFQHDLYGIILLFFGGLALAISRLKTNSLLPAIIMHSLVNLEPTIKNAVFTL